MISPILNHEIATTRQQDNERKIAAAELRRQAKANRHSEGSSEPRDRTVATWLPRLPAIGPVTGAWRSFARGLVAVVGRREPA
jgi:hypothetical protein